MGDRCYSTLVCNKKHLKIFTKMGYYIESKGEHSVDIFDEEANYANYEELNALEGKGIPFHGYHSEGSNFGASRFASDGRELLWFNCNHDGELVVCIDEKTGKVEYDGERSARRFLEVSKRAKEYCKADPDELASYGNPIPTAADKKIPDKKKRKK